jgi:PPM family protein phosphatase
MAYRIAYYMDIGLRETQEDCLLIGGQIVQQDRTGSALEKKASASEVFLAVCDGMGGHSRGEWASRFICERLGDLLKPSPFPRESTLAIFGKVQHEMEEDGAANSGSTLACVEMKKNAANVYNIGDSRVYKLTEKEITVLSHDHSLVQSMVDKGHLRNDEIRSHPYRHILEFGMGDIFAKQWRTSGKEIYLREDVLNAREYYLLCSDGVHDALTDGEMHDLLSPDPFGKLPEFIGRLKERIQDNASLIVIGNEG